MEQGVGLNPKAEKEYKKQIEDLTGKIEETERLNQDQKTDITKLQSDLYQLKEQLQTYEKAMQLDGKQLSLVDPVDGMKKEHNVIKKLERAEKEVG